MKEEYVNSFLAPAIMVWEKELGETLTVLAKDLVSNHFTSDDITAVIGVSGRLEGNVLFGFSEETALAMVSKMLDEQITDVHGEIALSAVGEIANMITGNAATRLSQIGYPCSISPPVIIEPMGSKFTIAGGPQIRVNFSSELGFFTVRIYLYETALRD